MIDLHSHLLPGVDDGARSLDVSCRVLERMAAEGVTTVVCTPHLLGSAVDDAPVAAHAELRATLQAAAPAGIRLVAGFEVMLDRPGCSLQGKGVSLGDSRAVLVEFPRGGVPPGAMDELLRLRASGVIPVLAHPERYRGVTIDLLHIWRDVGAVMQGDAPLLLGRGAMSDLARTMLAEGVLDVLASDNHGDRRSLAAVRLWLREMGGERQGRLLTEENPARLLRDDVLAPVPPLRLGRSPWQRLLDIFRRR